VSELATMSVSAWLGQQRERHGRARYVPFKLNLMQPTWGVLQLLGTAEEMARPQRERMVVLDGLTLVKARIMANKLNAEAAVDAK